jgi:hypothetical protein
MPQRKRAGTVKIVADASDVEAEPTVCDRLASSRVRRARASLKSATVITATGVEADTVMPLRRPR